MTHRKDGAEEAAIRLLDEIIAIDRRDRDALSGSAVKHVKAARKILAKRRRPKVKGLPLLLIEFDEALDR